MKAKNTTKQHGVKQTKRSAITIFDGINMRYHGILGGLHTASVALFSEESERYRVSQLLLHLHAEAEAAKEDLNELFEVCVRKPMDIQQ